MKKLSYFLCLCFLAACQANPTTADVSDPSTGSAALTDQANVYFFGQSLWAEPVFDRDVRLVQQAIDARYGNLLDSLVVGTEQISGTQSTATDEIALLADQARDGQDVVVVFFTSHGTEGSITVLPSGASDFFDWSAADIRDFLSPLEADRQVVILQACHSGSLIPALQHPNRIIITAARADRSSFGCEPGGDSTWFVKALTEEMASGGSWEEIFARTESSVLRYETEQGLAEGERSYPQFSVGAAMQDVWTGEADPQ
jgi:hypothetical protein